MWPMRSQMRPNICRADASSGRCLRYLSSAKNAGKRSFGDARWLYPAVRYWSNSRLENSTSASGLKGNRSAISRVLVGFAGSRRQLTNSQHAQTACANLRDVRSAWRLGLGRPMPWYDLDLKFVPSGTLRWTAQDRHGRSRGSRSSSKRQHSIYKESAKSDNQARRTSSHLGVDLQRTNIRVLGFFWLRHEIHIA